MFALTESPSSSFRAKRPRVNDELNYAVMKRLSLRSAAAVEDGEVRCSADHFMNIENLHFTRNSESALICRRRSSSWDATDDLNEIGEQAACDEDWDGSAACVLEPFCYRRKADRLEDEIIRKVVRRSNLEHSSISNALIPLDFDASLPVLGPKPTSDRALLSHPGVEDDVEDVDRDGEQQIFGLDHSLYEYHVAISRQNMQRYGAGYEGYKQATKFSGNVSHGECFIEDDFEIEKRSEKASVGESSLEWVNEDEDMEIL